MRDHRADYARAGARVLGISPDPVKKVKKFHDKQALDFTLLADEDHAVAEAYGVWVEKSMYGRTYWGNERTTFVVGPDGKVAEVLRKVKPAEHDARVLAALTRLTRRLMPDAEEGKTGARDLPSPTARVEVESARRQSECLAAGERLQHPALAFIEGGELDSLQLAARTTSEASARPSSIDSWRLATAIVSWIAVPTIR